MDVFQIALITVILYLYLKWSKTRKNIYIPIIFFLLALSINNHGVTIFFVFVNLSPELD